ncbi:unnamed protein product [Sphagnum jensenii]
MLIPATTAVWRGQPTILENPGPGPGKLVVREGEGSAVEQCLVVQDNNGRTRVRVLHQLLPRRNSITVYRESWEGPFRNGESLGGCASSTSAFGTQARVDASSLAGNWHVDQFATQTVTEAPAAVSEDVSLALLPYNLHAWIMLFISLKHKQTAAPAAEAKSCQITELTPVSSKEWERELLDDTIFLPKDLWTYVNLAQNGGTVIETGWLVNLDQSIVSGCQLESSGEIKGLAGGVLTQLFLPQIFLQEVYVRFERRISKM